MLTEEEIKQIAHLARIQVSQTEVTEFNDSLNNIFGMIDQLQSVDTQGVEPMAHPSDAGQFLRADQVSETNQREAYQACAPRVSSQDDGQEGLYLVPKVID
jgi:aspartyl-tRNA(Asn)/glutamyl-tRNA(Gln) amidotransferase subunit C